MTCRMMIAMVAVACWFASDAMSAWAAAKTLAVEAGPSARANVPMGVPLPAGTTKAKMMDGAKEVPCQVADGQLFWILDSLAAGASKEYTVDLGADSSANPQAVELKQTADEIAVTIDGQPFTSYRFAPKKFAGVQARRPYFYPVFGPNQAPMMRPFPCTDEPPPAGMSNDHPHHTSIWVAYGEVSGVDNWSVGEKAGWQVHTGFPAVVSGAVLGYFRETLDWTTAEKKPNMAEVRTVRFWRLPGTIRIMDFEITFDARYGPVVFGDTKEGGIISTRMRDEIRADKQGKNGRIVNAQGLSGADAWGKPSEWVDCSGTVGDAKVGYALFDAPTNFRHPTPWHARTYGLCSANPFGVAAFGAKGTAKSEYTLEAGKTLTLRYRIYFHTGDEKEAQVAARYADYAQPPKATWK